MHARVSRVGIQNHAKAELLGIMCGGRAACDRRCGQGDIDIGMHVDMIRMLGSLKIILVAACGRGLGQK
jgi:hypothetical protein